MRGYDVTLLAELLAKVRAAQEALASADLSGLSEEAYAAVRLADYKLQAVEQMIERAMEQAEVRA